MTANDPPAQSRTDRLVDELSEELRPVTPLHHPARRMLYWLMLCGAYIIGMTLWLFGLRDDLATVAGQPFWWLEIIFSLATAILAAIAGCYLAEPDSHQHPHISRWPVATFGILSMIIVARVLMAPYHNLWRTLGMEASPVCGVEMTLYAIPPGLILILMLRRAAPTRPMLAGTLTALAVGSFAYAFLRLTEPVDDPAHQLVWHYAPMLAFCLFGALSGRWILRW